MPGLDGGEKGAVPCNNPLSTQLRQIYLHYRGRMARYLPAEYLWACMIAATFYLLVCKIAATVF